MEIGWPTNVRHVAHVTFDRFNGFLGLPVEFEPDVPRRAPSASATVFGVSTESMQLSYDSRGNSVPTILLLMQRHLYGQGGLQAEGIFRINAENSQEEFVRDQLNRGVVPEGIDIHCLAGLIKAWFRELPTGVLDSLSPEQVMQCETEEDCTALVNLLSPTEASLLDWAINLMADVVQQEHLNKMNARNIAMVFAPNMTQMADPLTALMYAVQVMNFLKTLILRAMRERQDSVLASHFEPPDDSEDQSPSQSCIQYTERDNEEIEHVFVDGVPAIEAVSYSLPNSSTGNEEVPFTVTSGVKQMVDGDQSMENPDEVGDTFGKVGTDVNEMKEASKGTFINNKFGQSSDSGLKQGNKKFSLQPPMLCIPVPVEKAKRIRNLSRINSRIERIEAWR